jgi:hypothetical protein
MKNLLCIFASLCLLAGGVFAQEEPGVSSQTPQVEDQSVSVVLSEPNARIVSEQEFYFYNSNKMRVPLPVSQKAMVRFASVQKTGDEKTAYLKKYSPIEIESITAFYPRAEYTLGYLPTVDMKTMVGTIKKLSADQALEVAPVFIVDGMEAVVDGIYIETATPMSRETIMSAIKNAFGSDAMIHEITPVGGLWHVSLRRLFFLGEKGLPLHALSLANFLSTSNKIVWVKRAYPKFAFLRAPLVASVAVTPMSGTVGETRTIVLAIRIFGKNESEVVIDETGIPEFAQGNFTILADGKPPQSSFWDSVKLPPVKEARRQVGPNEWYVEHRYTIGLYAPEAEWVISGLNIPYVYKGKKETAEVAPVTFFVRPHLDEQFALMDIHAAYLLPELVFPGIAPVLPPAPAVWFDPVAGVIGGRGNLEASAWVLGVLMTALALFFFWIPIRRARVEAKRRSTRPHMWNAVELAEVLDATQKQNDPMIACAEIHDVVSTLLHQCFPDMPARHATFQQFKELQGKAEYQSLLARLDETFPDIEGLFESLELRQAPGFSGNTTEELGAHRDALIARVQLLGELLRTTKGG